MPLDHFRDGLVAGLSPTRMHRAGFTICCRSRPCSGMALIRAGMDQAIWDAACAEPGYVSISVPVPRSMLMYPHDRGNDGVLTQRLGEMRPGLRPAMAGQLRFEGHVDGFLGGMAGGAMGAVRSGAEK